MDYAAYRKAYFVDPPPKPAFAFSSIFGVALFIHRYEEAVAFYSRVLGQPAYVEGENTHGWRIGDSWLTLFPAQDENPKNIEITLLLDSPAEADRLRQAFINAGGTGKGPTDELMYEPFSFSFASDPFGTAYSIVARLG